MIKLLYIYGEVGNRVPVKKVSSSYSWPLGVTSEEAFRIIDNYRKSFTNVTYQIKMVHPNNPDEMVTVNSYMPL